MNKSTKLIENSFFTRFFPAMMRYFLKTKTGVYSGICPEGGLNLFFLCGGGVSAPVGAQKPP